MRAPPAAPRAFPSVVLFLMSAIVLAASSSPSTMVVENGQTYPKSITSFGREIEVRGTVEESVYLIGGKLTISGRIGQDVICFGSHVEIGDGAVIQKDLIIIGGSLVRAETAKVGGEFFYIQTRDDLKKFAQSLLPFLPDSADISFFRIIKVFFWLILALVTLAIFPAKVAEASALLEKRWRKVGVIGIVALIFFILFLLAFIILSLILIGIPLLLILIAGYFIVLVFGRTVAFYFMGRKISAIMNRRSVNPTFFVLIGVLIYGIFKFIPVAGVLFLVFLDVFVIGIGVGFFLRRKLLS
jgi:hypothetical protein